MNEDEGPCEDGFDNVDPDEIFDRPCDVVLNCWFVSLVVTGKLEEPEFDFNGQTVTLIHEGWLNILDEEWRERIAKPNREPV